MTLAKMAEGADCFSWPDPLAGARSAARSTCELADAGPTFKLEDYPGWSAGAVQKRYRALWPASSGATAGADLQPERLRRRRPEPPKPSWTADDFLNAAKQLTGEGGGTSAMAMARWSADRR